MIFEHNNYRAYLKTLFAERKRGNPSYSMRAFAKQIGLGQSALSQVLAGKKIFRWKGALRLQASLR